MDAPGRNNIRVMVPTITIFIWRQNSASWSWQLHGTILLKHCKNIPHNHNMVRTPGTLDISTIVVVPVHLTSGWIIGDRYSAASCFRSVSCVSINLSVEIDESIFWQQKYWHSTVAQWLYLLCSSQAAQVSALPSAQQSYINIAVATRHPGTTSIHLHGATSHRATNLQQNWY